MNLRDHDRFTVGTVLCRPTIREGPLKAVTSRHPLGRFEFAEHDRVKRVPVECLHAARSAA